MASQINMPQSGSFQASTQMRAASSVFGGLGLGGGAAGGLALSIGLTLIHFQRTALAQAPLRIASIWRTVAGASGLHWCGRQRASQLCSRGVR
jgi:hypothetical protein